MAKNYEIELYELVTNDDYVDEKGWISPTEFCVWVNYLYIYSFMEELKRIFGYGIFDDGSFDAKMSDNCLCIDLFDALCGYGVDFEKTFPKDKYKH